MPRVPAVPQIYPNNFAGPHGFPVWVRYCHFFNFLFVMMLIRSGLSILMDHPRLYFNDGCTPGSEWIRFTPLESSTRPHLDRERRCAIHLAARWHAGLPAHHWPCASVALHRCARLHRYGHSFSSSCCSIPSSGGALCQLRRSCFCKRGTRGFTTRRFTCRRSQTGFMAITHCNRSPISR